MSVFYADIRTQMYKVTVNFVFIDDASALPEGYHRILRCDV